MKLTTTDIAKRMIKEGTIRLWICRYFPARNIDNPNVRDKVVPTLAEFSFESEREKNVTIKQMEEGKVAPHGMFTIYPIGKRGKPLSKKMDFAIWSGTTEHMDLSIFDSEDECYNFYNDEIFKHIKLIEQHMNHMKYIKDAVADRFERTTYEMEILTRD